MSRGKLSASQLFWCAVVMTLPTLTLLLPSELIRLAGRFAWWTPLLAAVPAAGLAWLTGWLSGRLGDLAAVARRDLGPVAGWIATALTCACVGAYTVVIIGEVDLTVSATFLTGVVPLTVLLLLVLIPAGVAAWLGPVVIGRMAAILAPVLVFVYVTTLVVVLPDVHVLWALPLIPRNSLFADWSPLGLTWIWLIEPSVLGAVIMHRVQPAARRVAPRLMAGSVVLAGGLLAVGIWTLVADYGPLRAAEFVLPLKHAAEDLGYSQFFEHLDTVLTPVEIMGALLKLGLFIWIWLRLALRLVGTALAPARNVLVVVAVVGGGAVALAVFHNVLDVSMSLYRISDYVLPALVVLLVVPYGVGALGRRRSQA